MAKHLLWRVTGVVIIVGLLALMAGLAGAAGLIRIVSPKPGATLSGEVLVQLSVDSPEVTFVIFGVDGARPHATNSRPYSFSLDTTELSDGAHTLFAEVYSRTGLVGRSALIRIKVKNGQPAPTPAVVATQPAGRTTTPQAKAAPERPRAAVVPALTSRIAGATPEAGGQLQVIAAEPRLATESLSLPDADAPRALPLANQAQVPAVKLAQAAPATTTAVPCVIVNGQVVPLDVPVVIRDGRMEVAFRGVMTSAGWRVEWVPVRRTGVARAAGHRLEVTLGSEEARYDGQALPLGQKVTMAGNRLIVVLRPLCDIAGISLGWDQKTRTARLSSPNAPAGETVAEAP